MRDAGISLLPAPARSVFKYCSPTRSSIQSIVSMVSTGTELLIYRGQFDSSDEPLDATIKGLSEERLSYPMAYGYSLVGRIVRVGSAAQLGGSSNSSPSNGFVLIGT